MSILTTLWTLATQNWLGRIIAASMALLVAWKVNNFVVARNTTKKIVQASKIEGKARNDKSQKARADARKPGAADRLRHDACRDC